MEWLNVQAIGASFAVLAVSSVAGLLYLVGDRLLSTARQTLFCSVEMTNEDEIFYLVLKLLASQTWLLSGKKMQLKVRRGASDSFDFWSRDQDEQTQRVKMEFLPGEGLHVFLYRSKLIFLERSSSTTAVAAGWGAKPFVMQFMSIWVLGRDSSIFDALLQDALELSAQEKANAIKVFALNRWADSWLLSATKTPPRSISSLILPEDMARNVLHDMKTFFESAEWYKDNGIPHRRGYLLYGPPGNGKSSFIEAVCGELKLGICLLTLSNKSLSDETLASAIRSIPLDSAIVLEDVDSIFIDRETAQDNNQRENVTFSGLLNCLDGIASQEGRIMFMTTNHIEKLDPALVRPGRCDVKIFLGLANQYQLQHMFLRFYRNNAVDAKKFSNLVPENMVSMAELQGFFLRLRGHTPEQVLKETRKLIDSARDFQKPLGKIDLQNPIRDIRLDQWLKRLGLEFHHSKFAERQIEFLSDIKQIDIKELSEHGDSESSSPSNHNQNAGRR